MSDQYYDALLNIKTTGDQRGFNQSFHYHRYEPTPYEALDELFKEYELNRSDRLVDYGCGKGRLNFYAHHYFHIHATGIEMNEKFYKEAMENLNSYMKKNRGSSGKIHFQCVLAEEYKVDPYDNVFYFFNPFSIQIFIQVINNILLSVENHRREIELILYYASNEYIQYLKNLNLFELKKEIPLDGVSKHNQYERFLIYRLVY